MWSIAATIGVGLVTAYVASDSANKADKRAGEQQDLQREAMDQQQDAADQQLAFEKEQYDDWKEVYGDVQQNLSDYYSKLSPESLAAGNLDTFRREFAQAEKETLRRFAQLDVSAGAQAQLMQERELYGAEAEARIYNDAERQVRAEQQSFLAGSTLNPAGQGVSNAYGNLGNVANNQANFAGSQASLYANQAANYSNQAIGAGLGAITSYAESQRAAETQRPPAVYGDDNGFRPYTGS